jgi:uncharacterized protein with PQ loop repeat
VAESEIELTALIVCNLAFLGTVFYLFHTRIFDKFVRYFLLGEYLVAMVPLTAIGILLRQTALPILLIFLIHLALLFLLGIIPNFFR